MSADSLLAAAVDYCRRGWCPVPVRHRSKAGVPGWNTFNPTPEELERCFGNGPTNIGVLLGDRSGDLVDVDLDSPLARSLAPSFLSQTDCVFGRKGAPGSHFIYRCSPAPTTVKFLDPMNGKRPLVELRSTGHHTVFPPSIHPSGEQVEFERRGEPARVAPDVLARQLGKLAAATAIAGQWNPGNRHEISLALSGLLLRAAWREQEVTEFITQIARAAGDEEWAERSWDVETTARRIEGSETVKGGPSLGRAMPEVVARQAAKWLEVDSPASPKSTGVAEAVLICAADVEPEQIEWLWPGRIAKKKLTILDGDPGLGKSTVLIDLASRFTTGRPMPGSDRACEPRGVVIASCEDGMADTIVPRLKAADADRSRVGFFTALQEANGTERLPEIPEDLHAFERVIEEMNARLVIIDPLMGYLSNSADSWKDQSVRKALAPLAALAERSGAAIVVVRHLKKGEHESAIYAGGGSIAIIGQARTGLLVTENPENPEERILSVTKCNVAAKAPSLRFRFSTPSADRPEPLAPRIEWLGESTLSADELVQKTRGLRRTGPKEVAEGFLTDVLSDGPKSANWIQAQASKRGISEPTLNRAKEPLGVWSRRREWLESRGVEVGESDSPDDLWFWLVPSEEMRSDPGES